MFLPRGRVLIYSYRRKTRNIKSQHYFLAHFCNMAFRSNFLFFVLMGIQRRCATMVRDDRETVNVAVFFNASDRYLPRIIQNTEDMFRASRLENNLQQNENSLKVSVSPRWLDASKIGHSHIGLNDSLYEMWNISSQIQGAIFVDINSDSLFGSSFLERLAVPTIGIFQRKEQPQTQVRWAKI